MIDGKSTLVQVMAWCHQATSHYLSQCWPTSVLQTCNMASLCHSSIICGYNYWSSVLWIENAAVFHETIDFISLIEYITWLILSLHLANERRCYKVTPSLIGWAQTKNQPCIIYICCFQIQVLTESWSRVSLHPWTAPYSGSVNTSVTQTTSYTYV